jgi:hypothetical protein
MLELLLSTTERFVNCIQTHADATAFSECTLHPQEGGSKQCARCSSSGKHFLDKHCTTCIHCVENDCKGVLRYGLTKWLQDRVMYAQDSIDSGGVELNLMVDGFEPHLSASQWMPVLCQTNYVGTRVMNGALCWVDHVIHKNKDDLSKCQWWSWLLQQEVEVKHRELLPTLHLMSSCISSFWLLWYPFHTRGRRNSKSHSARSSTIHKAHGSTLT